MNFVDYSVITVKSGNGGPGAVSFHREKFVPMGGPDGGDGGKGGDVVFLADPQLHTLHDLRYRKIYKAKSGQPGGGNRRSGKNGADVTIRVPVGTLIRCNDEVLVDLTEDYQTFIAAEGGKGGRGNQHYATPVNQIPRYAQDGIKGTELELELELKVLADVGLVGFPNAGKSTLLSVISSARPKIADYPFTTLVPNLGIVKYGEYRSFVMADIPGLIEGAHTGRGLGDQFLRHIERTRVLLYLIDVNEDDPLQRFEVLRSELKAYSPELLNRKYLVCLTKCDSEAEYLPLISEDIPARNIFYISSVTRRGISELVQAVTAVLDELD